MESSANIRYQSSASSKDVYFDPHCLEFNKNPYPTYKLLQSIAPIMYWAEGKAWLLTKHKDVLAIQRDDRFSINLSDWCENQSQTEGNDSWAEFKSNDLLALAGDSHQRVRRIVMPFFMPDKLHLITDSIHTVINSKIDQLDGKLSFDLIKDYVKEIPIGIMANFFAIPDALFDDFFRFACGYVDLFDPGAVYSPSDRQKKIDDVTNGLVLVKEIISERRQLNQREYLIDYLIGARDDNDSLSDEELVALVGMLIAGGSDSTMYLISNTIFNLLLHPEALDSLGESAALWPNAIKEVLRFDFFMKLGVPRYALEDLVFNGFSIKKGQMVYPVTAAAQRDPEIHVNPDGFDIHRDTRDVIAFGRSKHVCIGQHLALLETELAARALFDKFPDLRLASNPTYEESNRILRAMSSLELSGI